MSEVSDFLREAVGDEAFLHIPERQFGKTKTTMMFFIGTPMRTVAMKFDPKAAERAKRYIWPRIERNQANNGRGE